ncbi:epoxide hydrolase family protein [Curtobacterium sp. S6]|uniref:epoxide hydrolase family protein n=1 Tax=Curtobacterium sp. S6 TaxID=1479623 RepID=UPI0004AA65A1|nr:epoxide hydrolase [Curtobacterium sp. S6]
MTSQIDTIKPFELHIDSRDLEDLRTRLRMTRYPEAATRPGNSAPIDRWEQGPPLEEVRALVSHWATDYSWRACEEHLNQVGQFKTVIDGVGIHFLHRRSPRPDATPLLITHGWPGSVIEFAHLVDDLAEPIDTEAPAFHVVIPSLPGFGFSDKPENTGWGTEKIASAWVELMDRLGYPRFLAQGGDWGGVITTILAGRFPDHVIGIHSTFNEGPVGQTKSGLTSTDLEWVVHTQRFQKNHTAYAKVQADQPQTMGYSLVDSPVGLLTWILDKFFEWTDTKKSPFESIQRDAFLDNVSMYWFSATGASAARIYYESFGSLDPELTVDVPAAITTYPHDIAKTPRPWAQRRYRNIVHWQTPLSGGHFPSLEMPQYFLGDVRKGLAIVLNAARQ